LSSGFLKKCEKFVVFCVCVGVYADFTLLQKYF